MTDIVLRSPTTEAELKAWYEPLAEAFGEDLSPEEIEAERPFMELDRLINAFDGERRVASSGAFSMQLTVPGGAVVAVSGITGVGVVPDARRRGVLRSMMGWLFEDAVKHHEPLAILWASEAAIYQRFGFGMGTLVSSFEVDRDRIVFREPLPPRDDVRVRLVGVEEGARLAAPIYDQIRARAPGTLEREELEWSRMIMADASWMRGKNGPKYRAVVEVGGEPRGYATYRINGDWSVRGSANTVVIVDFQALDPEAEQYLWQWLVSMDLATTVKTMRGPFPHPLQLMLLEPRRLGLTVGDGMWLRIVDVAAALSARSYAGEGSLVLELTDTVLPANAGRWQLTVGADGAGVVAPTTAEPDLALDIAALAGTYLGAWRFIDLAAAGRVRECHPGTLHTADMLFTPSRDRVQQHDVLGEGNETVRTGRVRTRSFSSPCALPLDSRRRTSSLRVDVLPARRCGLDGARFKPMSYQVSADEAVVTVAVLVFDPVHVLHRLFNVGPRCDAGLEFGHVIDTDGS